MGVTPPLGSLANNLNFEYMCLAHACFLEERAGGKAKSRIHGEYFQLIALRDLCNAANCSFVACITSQLLIQMPQFVHAYVYTVCLI